MENTKHIKELFASLSTHTEVMRKALDSNNTEVEIKMVNEYLHLFSKVKEVRKHIKKIVYPLANLLTIIFLARLYDFDNPYGWVVFCNLRKEFLTANGVLGEKIPEHDTFARILTLVDPEDLNTILVSKLCAVFDNIEEHINNPGDFVQINIDGKDNRGSGRASTTTNPSDNVCLVNVYDTNKEITLFSVPCNGTSEQKTGVKLLNQMCLTNTIVTGDAAHAYSPTTNLIHDKGGYYLITMKGNQKTIYEEIVNMFQKPELFHKSIIAIELEEDNYKKTFEFIDMENYYRDDLFKGLTYVVKFTKTDKKGNITIRYFITSIKKKEVIITAVKKRWCVENDLHRHKDMLLGEDQIRYKNKTYNTNMAILNNTVLSFIKIVKAVIPSVRSVKYAKKSIPVLGESIIIRVITLLGTKELMRVLFSK